MDRQILEGNGSWNLPPDAPNRHQFALPCCAGAHPSAPIHHQTLPGAQQQRLTQALWVTPNVCTQEFIPYPTSAMGPHCEEVQGCASRARNCTLGPVAYACSSVPLSCVNACVHEGWGPKEAHHLLCETVPQEQSLEVSG